MAKLVELCRELLLMIAVYLPRQDLHALFMVCNRLNEQMAPSLYREFRHRPSAKGQNRMSLSQRLLSLLSSLWRYPELVKHMKHIDIEQGPHETEPLLCQRSYDISTLWPLSFYLSNEADMLAESETTSTWNSRYLVHCLESGYENALIIILLLRGLKVDELHAPISFPNACIGLDGGRLRFATCFESLRVVTLRPASSLGFPLGQLAPFFKLPALVSLNADGVDLNTRMDLRELMDIPSGSSSIRNIVLTSYDAGSTDFTKVLRIPHSLRSFSFRHPSKSISHLGSALRPSYAKSLELLQLSNFPSYIQFSRAFEQGGHGFSAFEKLSHIEIVRSTLDWEVDVMRLPGSPKDPANGGLFPIALEELIIRDCEGDFDFNSWGPLLSANHKAGKLPNLKRLTLKFPPIGVSTEGPYDRSPEVAIFLILCRTIGVEFKIDYNMHCVECGLGDPDAIIEQD